MREADFDAFSGMLDAICSLLSRGSYVPSSTNTALFFRSLARYDLAQVRSAFDAHVSDPQRGRFVPVPADLIAQIEGSASNDGRPGAEEAWAIALSARDENATVVWTEEISLAWGACQSIVQAGDDVAARMAFREAYLRLVGESRAAGDPVVWNTSLGHDPDLHQPALERAAELGRIEAPKRVALPPPEQSMQLIAGNPLCPPHVREKLLAIRAELAQSVDGRQAGSDGPIIGDFKLVQRHALPPAMRGDAE